MEKEEFNSYFDMDELLHNKNIETNPKILAKKVDGDRVNVIDFSSLTHENGDELTDEDQTNLNCDIEFIVINTNQKNKYYTEYISYTQNLIIFYPNTNQKFRVSSIHTKLIK